MGFIQLKLPKKIRRKKLPNTARKRKALAYHQSWLEKRGLDTKSLKKEIKNLDWISPFLTYLLIQTIQNVQTKYL